MYYFVIINSKDRPLLKETSRENTNFLIPLLIRCRKILKDSTVRLIIGLKSILINHITPIDKSRVPFGLHMPDNPIRLLDVFDGTPDL